MSKLFSLELAQRACRTRRPHRRQRATRGSQQISRGSGRTCSISCCSSFPEAKHARCAGDVRCWAGPAKYCFGKGRPL